MWLLLELLLHLIVSLAGLLIEADWQKVGEWVRSSASAVGNLVASVPWDRFATWSVVNAILCLLVHLLLRLR
jgi:hypothetical protein